MVLLKNLNSSKIIYGSKKNFLEKWRILKYSTIEILRIKEKFSGKLFRYIIKSGRLNRMARAIKL